MLTVYPFQGFANITDEQLADMATRLNNIVNAGHSVFFRFAAEMNGSWFQYGQDPAGFIAAWRRCITYWRHALGANVDKVAFIWSPNSGNGYPYAGEEFSINPNATDAATLANIALLDTNQNGILDPLDDPYIPYYPGDEYVDWVGLSIYHYGIEYPWVDNAIPAPNELNGSPTNGAQRGYYPFYTYFSSPTGCINNITKKATSSGNKPFIASETAAVYHFAWVNQSVQYPPDGNRPVPGYGQATTRLEIKQAWWKSFLNPTFLAKYPRFKAACTFEFVKSEELTWRDFTVFGPLPNPPDVGGAFLAGREVVSALVVDLASMPFLAFAKTAVRVPNVSTVPSASIGLGANTSSGDDNSGSGSKVAWWVWVIIAAVVVAVAVVGVALWVYLRRGKVEKDVLTGSRRDISFTDLALSETGHKWSVATGSGKSSVILERE
ncbi:hypothetical protein HDU98_009935 [Podochytrium sp. JEL0797]|nr:hypothetical protein HDU98_009935 [Podochytrium sp. JEL0797]